MAETYELFRVLMLCHTDEKHPSLYQGEAVSPCSTWAAAFSSSPAVQPMEANPCVCWGLVGKAGEILVCLL